MDLEKMSKMVPTTGRGRGRSRLPVDVQNGGSEGCCGRVGHDKATLGSFLPKQVKCAVQPVGRGINSDGERPVQPAQSTMFEEACEKIRISSQKLLQESGQFADDVSSDSDGDMESKTEQFAAVLDKVLGPYTALTRDPNVGRTQPFLLDCIKSGAIVCLICIETIKATEAVWSCEGCYCIFHLPCLQKWAKDSIGLQADGDHVTDSLRWCCPKCRHEYDRRNCPTQYTCFCGKEADPKFDPWLVPHSCGQVCGRDLRPSCGHRCLLLCHPGPCPKCPKMIQTSCFCGQQRPQARRCSNRQWSCGKLCGRTLLCGQHSCSAACHKGECPPCLKRSDQYCACGLQKCSRLCADIVWQCTKVCDRPLPCGNHRCTVVCHEGPCGDCPRSRDRTCPCGNTVYQLPCDQDVPTCGDTCGKVMKCGIHRCARVCHAGACGQCLQVSTKRCRCGLKKKLVPCHKDLICESRCKTLRACTRHSCNKRCCAGQCPPCEQQCDRMLACRNHRCSSLCHSGPCYPCPLTVAVKCRCGGTAVSVPCGRERLTKPPKCSKLCAVPPACHHPQCLPHRCHFGNCPPCKQVCNKRMPCSHPCPAACHSVVQRLVKVEQKRAGPWESVVPPRIETVCLGCPPCHILVPVTCLGGHETRDVECFASTRSSCSRECGRWLPCGNHACILRCHTVTNAPSETTAGTSCAPCEEPCRLQRPKGCPHPCLLPCHPRPCPPCDKNIRQRCHCKLRMMTLPCRELTAASAEEHTRRLSCGSQCPREMVCKHSCIFPCHNGACSPAEKCQAMVTVTCECKRVKRGFWCCDVQKGNAVVPCSSICQDSKKVKQEEELRKTQDREKKVRRQNVERKKSKPKKQTTEEPHREARLWGRYRMVLVSTFIPVVAILVYFVATF